MKKLTKTTFITLTLLSMAHAAKSESHLAPGAPASPVVKGPKAIDLISLTPAAATGVVVTAVLVARADMAPGLDEVCDNKFDVDPTECPQNPSLPKKFNF